MEKELLLGKFSIPRLTDDQILLELKESSWIQLNMTLHFLSLLALGAISLR